MRWPGRSRPRSFGAGRRSLIADGAEHAAALSSGFFAIGWRDLIALAFVPLASAGLASWISAGAVKRFLRQDHAN